MKSTPSAKELEEIYTPNFVELVWAEKRTRERTPRVGLLVLLKTFQRPRFAQFSRVKHLKEVSPLSRPVMLSVWLTQPVSTSLQRGIRFFSFRTPAALWIRLAAFLPYAGNVTGITLLPSK